MCVYFVRAHVTMNFEQRRIMRCDKHCSYTYNIVDIVDNKHEKREFFIIDTRCSCLHMPCHAPCLQCPCHALRAPRSDCPLPHHVPTPRHTPDHVPRAAPAPRRVWHLEAVIRALSGFGSFGHLAVVASGLSGRHPIVFIRAGKNFVDRGTINDIITS